MSVKLAVHCDSCGKESAEWGAKDLWCGDCCKAFCDDFNHSQRKRVELEGRVEELERQLAEGKIKCEENKFSS